jgi:integrase
VMAYAGLRQGEASGLKWRQIDGSQLAISAPAIGYASEEMRNLQERSIHLIEPLAEDLAKWRAQCGNPERGYVFPDLRERDWHEWVKGDYRRAAKHASRGNKRPAALSHTFCALLIAEGASLDDVTRQAGLPKSNAVAQYGHLFEVARVNPPVSAAEQIRAARAAVFETAP